MMVFRYVADSNPQGLMLTGVPLRDLTDGDVARMDDVMRQAVATCAFYEAVTVETKKQDAQVER